MTKTPPRCICICTDEHTPGSALVYHEQVQMIPRWNQKPICIDRCIAPEIIWLWGQGITTQACCCGHGDKVEASIVTLWGDMGKMLELGYKLAKWQPEGVESINWQPLSLVITEALEDTMTTTKDEAEWQRDKT